MEENKQMGWGEKEASGNTSYQADVVSGAKTFDSNGKNPSLQGSPVSTMYEHSQHAELTAAERDTSHPAPGLSTLSGHRLIWP